MNVFTVGGVLQIQLGFAVGQTTGWNMTHARIVSQVIRWLLAALALLAAAEVAAGAETGAGLQMFAGGPKI